MKITTTGPAPIGLTLIAFLAGTLLSACAQVGAEPPAAANLAALRLAVEDFMADGPEAYPNGPVVLKRIAAYEARLGQSQDEPLLRELAAFQREVLLSNPLLKDIDRVLVVRRNAGDPALGLPQNWQGNCSLPLNKYDNEIATFSLHQPEPGLKRLFKPDKPLFVGDVDLHFDGDRMLFSMPGSHGRSQIWEIRADGTGLRQVTLGAEGDVDNYDACYLPDGRIVYGTTACYQGIPCVAGGDFVANLCVMNADGTGARLLCFDQDHDWCPVVLNNGRVMYTRWEYTDLPHSNTRLLFHMNPDGTGQMEYYGSNSYWPTAVMYARPVPNHPTKVAAIVTGHHGVPRMGELVVFDPALGRNEAEGAVRRIPGRGERVEPVILDNLVDESWPKFLHPCPLSDKYFLVSCKPGPDKHWGVYLVDVFDNMLLLHEESGQAIFEPVPLRPTATPPVIPDRVKPGATEGTVYISDIYTGPGLRGVPRGAVKSLRVFSYTYGYRHTGGLLGVIGMDGPWDIKRILGTVPVEVDGSVLFRAPANTPLAVQPLDEKGRALQLMRSWFTAMPGEAVSCVGCHERQNSTPPPQSGLAARRAPDAITPWRGAERGFNFPREVQPVLDLYCLPCHDGTAPDRPDLRGGRMLTDWSSAYPGSDAARGGRFSHSYAELHRFVRRPGIESDYRMLPPMEFHAGTTELVQMLEQGHHGVELDAEAWDRINTWIDLNAPYHGTWTEILGAETMGPIAERRRELMRQYANVDTDHEAIVPTETGMAGPKTPPVPPPPGTAPGNAEKPLNYAVATGAARTVDLGNGVTMELVQIPGTSPVLWMGRHEVTNEQYGCFDPAHDSGVESMHAYQFGIHGYPLNGPRQPVVRVSWNRAMDFCAWLSEKTGLAFTLPAEAEWEHACRAGTDTPFYWGGLDTDFSGHANLGDARLSEFARNTYIQVNLLEKPNRYDDWIPKEERFDDGHFIAAEVGRYAPNPWGLFDMHGNVREWTRSTYPEGLDLPADGGPDARRTVRGGSWYDRPKRATASSRAGYAEFQPVFDVGFRVALTGP